MRGRLLGQLLVGSQTLGKAIFKELGGIRKSKLIVVRSIRLSYMLVVLFFSAH